MKKAKAASGWWINLRVPAGTLEKFRQLLPPGVDAQTFVDWFEPELAKYRSAVSNHEAPSRAQEIAGARRLVTAIDETLAALRDLPPQAKAIVRAASDREVERTGTTWLELARRVEIDLTLLHVLIHSTAQSLAKTSAKRGRPKSTPRDELLDSVVRRLRESKVPARKARTIAAAVLTHCQIKFVPTAERTIRRAAKRGGGKK